MKFSVLATSLLSAVALAAPAADPEPEPEAISEALTEASNEFFKRSPPTYGDTRFQWGGKFGPIPFNRQFRIRALPRNVVDSNNTFTGGKRGAVGFYSYGINTEFDLICYHILLRNFGDVDYQSLAKTSTHIHQGDRGMAGPPRISFPNPQPVGDERISVGCLQGPFTTGINDTTTGQDTGTGFTISMLEADPTNYFTDVHTTDAVPGAVRGQFGPGRFFFGYP